MSKTGYVKLYRSLQDHWLAEDKPYCFMSAWIDLLLMANYNGDTMVNEEVLVQLPKGCLATKQTTLMNRWGWSNTKVKNFLKKLQIQNMITFQTFAKQITITILGWEKHQQENCEKNVIKTAKKLEFELDGEMDSEILKLEKDDKKNGKTTEVPVSQVYMYKNIRREEYKEKEINKEKEKRVQELFNQFWLEYPKKVSKQDAIKAFSKIDENEIPLLMEVLKKYKCSAGWLENGGRFIPHPATWLNGRRWEDEIEVKIDQNPTNCINPKNPNEVILTNGSIYAKNYCVFENGKWRRK